MKFKFRMQKVLEHRKTLEDIAKSDLEDAVHRYNAEVEKLQKMIDDKKQSRVVTFDYQTDQQTSGIEKKFIFAQADSFQKLQDIRIEKQKEVVKVLEKEVESKRDFLKIKAIDYKIIDKFKDNKREQFKDELKKKEQNENDEIVILRHVSGSKK
jgi:flagellar FliJ protein